VVLAVVAIALSVTARSAQTDSFYLELCMARKKDWKTDREFLHGDLVMDDIRQRKGKVIRRVSEDMVIVKFEDSDEEEEVNLGHVRRLMR
jgi:hypothetical protein